MFCPSSNLVVPYKEEVLGAENGDVTLEMDNFGN
jgi:hypothetical protein